jgi:ubiquinone/menaquinone biosynthesis C-methylase UbiE
MDIEKTKRYVKYGIAAPLICKIMRHSSILDGTDYEPLDTINFSGAGKFREIGDQQVSLLVDRAGLKEGDKVLDVGCGIGRIALPLSRSFPGLRYSGFDIVSYGVEWASKKLRGFNSFELKHVDVYNSFYNPRGKESPDAFIFPFPSNHYDLAFATSVFTHLLDASAFNYMREVSRCLVPGGRAYVTTFICDGHNHSDAYNKFTHRFGRSHVASFHEPEMAVAYSISVWENMATSNGMKIEKTFAGSWCRDGNGDDFQDAILFVKI